MRRDLSILLAVVVAACVSPVLIEDRFMLDMIVLILIFGTFASAWNIAGGMTGLFSLGHASLFAIGAYGTVILASHGVPTLVAIALSAGGAVLTALLIGLMSLRLRGHYFALATLAFGMTVIVVLSNFSDVTGGDEGLNVPFEPDAMSLVFDDKQPYIIVAAILYALVAAATIALRHSRLGFRMRAVREDEVSARAVGVPVLRTKLTAFMLSGLFAALAGSLYAQYTLYITPATTASITVSLQPALMAIIGGMLGVFGPLLGAVLIIVLEQQVINSLGTSVPGLTQAVYGGLLILSIIVLPNGLLSLSSRVRGWRPRRRPTVEPITEAS